MEETKDNNIFFNYNNSISISHFYVPNQIVKYYLEFEWLNFGGAPEHLVFCVNDKIKWYTKLLIRLLGGKFTRVK